MDFARIASTCLDPDNLAAAHKTSLNFGSGDTKAWKDIWGVGQGMGNIDDLSPVGELVARLRREYEAAQARICDRAGAV